jgi:hypothetical protein
LARLDHRTYPSRLPSAHSRTRSSSCHAAEIGAHHTFIHLNDFDRGNRFAAWQEPEPFAAEIRAAFASLC